MAGDFFSIHPLDTSTLATTHMDKKGKGKNRLLPHKGDAGDSPRWDMLATGTEYWRDSVRDRARMDVRVLLPHDTFPLPPKSTPAILL